MDQPFRVLFVCGGNSARSQMAEGLLRSRGDAHLVVASAGLVAEGVRPLAIEAMKEIGIDISKHRSKAVSDLGSATFDLIVTLCEPAKEYCVAYLPVQGLQDEPARLAAKNPVLAGVPYQLHWSVPNPVNASGSHEQRLLAFRTARDLLLEHIERLLNDGYLIAFREERRRLVTVLDSLKDGLLIHDDQRRIQLFNQAAERITGFSREEVIGRRCQDVFAPGGFCGGQCDYMHGTPAPSSRNERDVLFVTKDGDDRRVKMVVSTTAPEKGKPSQTIATIRDVTDFDALERKSKKKRSLHGMVAISSVMKDVFETIRQVSSSDYSILILGESGTGKELTANAIHNESHRKGGPFVPVNCGALPENILESELFGHVRGAFTGAIRNKKGRFELAHRGTLFLDEVGELSAPFQVKLLRVLEEKRFEKVGGEKPISVDVRFVAATNRNLDEMVKDGSFREDLFYRLAVVPITLPPLRDRPEDIPPLIEQILSQIREESGKPINSISDEALDLVMSHGWPGNVRELINALQFASIRCSSSEILPNNLPPNVGLLRQPDDSTAPLGLAPLLPHAETPRRRKLSIEAVHEAMHATRGNKVKAAKLLGVGRATLYRFFESHPHLK